MLKYYKILVFIIFTCFSSFSCQSNNLPDEQNMTVVELKEAITADTTLVILDVRTPPELEEELGKIEGVINIPVQVLRDRITELENYKNSNIAVICRSGNRSVTATIILSENGFQAKNVLGGMRAYNKL